MSETPMIMSWLSSQEKTGPHMESTKKGETNGSWYCTMVSAVTSLGSCSRQTSSAKSSGVKAPTTAICVVC